jgi:hypothetical protein
MLHDPSRQPLRRLLAGARAIARGLPGMALIALAALVFVPDADAAAPVTLENQTFPGAARIAGVPLQLNGVGLRAAFIYKVYLAGLYLPTRVSSGAAALAESGPKRVQLRLLMDAASGEFARAFTGGLSRHLPADRVASFDRSLRSAGDRKKGDVVNLDYAPDVGLTLTVNDRSVGSPLPGADLYAALLDSFVGAAAVDARLKAGMLGMAS